MNHKWDKFHYVHGFSLLSRPWRSVKAWTDSSKISMFPVSCFTLREKSGETFFSCCFDGVRRMTGFPLCNRKKILKAPEPSWTLFHRNLIKSVLSFIFFGNLETHWNQHSSCKKHANFLCCQIKGDLEKIAELEVQTHPLMHEIWFDWFALHLISSRLKQIYF